MPLGSVSVRAFQMLQSRMHIVLEILIVKCTLNWGYQRKWYPTSNVCPTAPCHLYIVDLRDTAMGHDARQVKGIGRGMMGRGQVIQKLKCARLVWAAGSDLRADGHAVAQI
jgi:gamma-glutamyltranspeptidase